MKITKAAVISFLLVPCFIFQADYTMKTCEKWGDDGGFTITDSDTICKSGFDELLIKICILAGLGFFFATFIIIWQSREPKKFSLLNQEKGK